MELRNPFPVVVTRPALAAVRPTIALCSREYRPSLPVFVPTYPRCYHLLYPKALDLLLCFGSGLPQPPYRLAR